MNETAAAKAAGLEIVDLRMARLHIEIHDVAAAVYLLRKVIWWVPGFTVEKYLDRLRDLHDLIQKDGPFIAHSTRHLIEARRPSTRSAGVHLELHVSRLSSGRLSTQSTINPVHDCAG